MFREIFAVELLYWLKKPTTYFFGIVFFGLTFLLYAGSAGLFDPHSEGSEVNELLNSSYGINFILLYLNKLLIVLIPTIVGVSIHKDFKYRVHSILFSFPLNKIAYLGARVSASFCVVLIIVVGMIFCMVLVEHLPGVDPSKMGPLTLPAYLQVIVIYLLPNLVFMVALVVAIILFTRNIYVAFVASLIPFLIQVITENAFVGNDVLIALSDPFGQNSLSYYTQNWSILDRNHKPLPIAGLVLYNRLLWLGVSATLLAISVKSFKLHESLSNPLTFSFNRNKTAAKKSSLVDFELDEVRVDHSHHQHWKALWHLSSRAFSYIAKSPIFLVIVSFGIVAMVFALDRVTETGDMVLMPLTKVILVVPAKFYTLTSMLLLFIYSGLLIHRESNARIAQLFDSTLTPSWVYWGSKFLALIKVKLLLLLVFLIAGLGIQLSQGYFNFEVGLYTYHLLLFVGVPLLIWTAAAFFIHTLLNHFYLSLFVLILGWIGIEGLPQIGVDSYLIRFNTPPPLHYSDLNGYGVSDRAFFTVEGYWLAFGSLLLVGCHLLWPNGMVQSLGSRINDATNRTSPLLFTIAGLAIVSMIVLGFRIKVEESKKLDLAGNAQKGKFKRFETQFRRYEHLRSPKIQTLSATIELYPNNHSFEANGTYSLENSWDEPIDTLLIRTGFDEISTFRLSRDYELIAADSFMRFYVVRLHESMLAGEQMTVSFDIKNKPNSLFERSSNVLENGTFIKHDIFPRFGYSFKDESNNPSDSTSKYTHYQGLDSDLIDIHLIIGTSGDQIAIGPGALKSKERKNNRNYFEYATVAPVKFSFGINSGKYTAHQSLAGQTALEIYSHHNQNLDVIEASINNTLSYMEPYFGSYRFDKIRVIEFPDSEGSYSTAFANNIPMSEVRFVSNANEKNEKTNLSYYVPAHELIHHWWGSTMIPASAKGASMLTESITEYLTLKVYEMQYGKGRADNFLRLQHQRYWNGHNRSTSMEPPLSHVEDGQQYISYGKGAIAMNGLSAIFGEEKFNGVLFDFLTKHDSGTPPYPTSIDFVNHLKASTSDTLHAFIEELFMKIMYHDNSIEEADLKQLPSGLQRLKLKLQPKKWTIDPADIRKNPTATNLNEWIQIGFYASNDELMAVQWIHLIDNDQEYVFDFKKRPSKVVLDPNLLLLDKNHEDNSFAF